MNRVIRIALLGFIASFIAFLLLPLVVVVLASFNDGPVLSFPPPAFTARWYGEISDEFWASVLLSLRIATTNMILATLVGVPTALALVRSSLPGKTALNALCLSPLMVPSLVIAVSSYQFAVAVFDLTGINYIGTETGIVIGHCALGIPFVIRAVIAGQAHSDHSIEEAARGLGAGAAETFIRITLPLLAPSILSGAIFAFLVSFEDLAISLFMGGTGTPTLPVQIYSTVEFSLGADVMAISAIVIFASFAVLLAVNRLIGIERVLSTTGGRL